MSRNQRKAALCIAAVCAFPIFADDAPAPEVPKVRVSASDPVAFRGLSTGGFTVYREDTNGTLTVQLAFGGSASNGVDYAEIPTSVTIPAGFHAVGLEVDPLGDGASNPNKVVVLSVVTNAAYRVTKSPHASVLIKGNEFENRAPTVAITSPADNTSFGAGGVVMITAEAADPNDSVRKVSFYAGDRYLGSDSEAPYSLTWSNVPSGKFALFARAEDAFGKSALSAPVNITATNPPTGGGVVLTSPMNGATFAAQANITLAAELKGTAGALQSVSYFAGDKLLGTAGSEPFSLIWSNVPPGTYKLTAKATETNGAISTSAKVVVAVTNDAPTVSILSPTNSTVMAGPADVRIDAQASDANGISSVMFFGGERFLGTVKAAPYSLTWSNAPAGKQTITVRAVDNFGASKSASVQITLSNTPPSVKLLAPTNNTVLTARATFELKAEASDADGIKYVTFLAGKDRLESVKTAPYTLTLRNLRAGTYSFRAEAVDNAGQRTVSDAVKVVVVR